MKKNVGKLILALVLAVVMVVGVVSPVAAAKPVRTFTIDSMELVDMPPASPYRLRAEVSFDNWGAWGYRYLLRKDVGGGNFQDVASGGPYFFSAGRITSGSLLFYSPGGLTPGTYELFVWLIGHKGRPIKRIGYATMTAALSAPSS